MEAGFSDQEVRPQPPIRFNRILYCLVVASFFLPFATVRSCAGDEGEGVSYTGVELLAEDAGALLVGVVLLAAVLLVFSFRRRAYTALIEGILSASKALLCAFAILTTFFATGMTFMFSRVSLQTGFYLCVGSWLALFVLSTRTAFRYHAVARAVCREPPPPLGLVVGILATIVILATSWISEPNGFAELLLGVFAGFLIAVPITVMAMILAAYYQLRRQETSAGE